MYFSIYCPYCTTLIKFTIFSKKQNKRKKKVMFMLWMDSILSSDTVLAFTFSFTKFINATKKVMNKLNIL